MIIKHPDFHSDGHIALQRNRGHHIINKLPFVLKPRAVTTAPRYALGASQVKIYSITLMLNLLDNFDENFGVMAGELAQNGAVRCTSCPLIASSTRVLPCICIHL